MANKMEINDLLEKGILEAKYMEVLEMLMRLRQICCHPILFKSVANFIQAHDF
jgi:SNF2 family DNA or RNA helicase